MKKNHLWIFSLIASISSRVCAQTIVDLVVDSDILTTLETAVVAADFVDALSADDANLTVFAPTDEAFGDLPDGLLELYLTDNYAAHLRSLLSHHVVPGVVPSSDLMDGMVVNSLLAPLTPNQIAPLTFTVTDDDEVFVSGRGFNDSQVIDPDIEATNGIVHIVDQVFLPEVICCLTIWTGIQQVPEFSILASFIEQTGLADVLDMETATLFSPPNQVLGAIPDETLAAVNVTAVLLNHVVLGPPLPVALLVEQGNITTALGVTLDVTTNDVGMVMVGGVPIVFPDAVASNGIGHVIGGALIPPPMEPVDTSFPTAAPSAAMDPGDTVPTMAPSGTPPSTSEAASLSTMGKMCFVSLITVLFVLLH